MLEIDCDHRVCGPRGGFESLAHQVKARTNGPVSKAFNVNFAALYEQVSAQRARPCCLYCAEDEARAPTEQLIRDAGYEPVLAGGLGNARPLEDFVPLLMEIVQSGTGMYFYRFARPGELGPGRRREISCKETFRVDSMPPGGNSWTRNRSETGTHRCKEAFNPEAWARPGSRITPRIGCEARLPRSRGDLFPRCACTRVPWLLPRNQPRPTHRRKLPRRE